ncbi:hypothetical protein IJH16_00010 [Candidatus Saccharibacteria bacterium]|nr:hypothetical protein [Candidatus Saccharibacteria bacterium]
MYSTVGLLKNSKHSGRLIGTHQKLDRAALKYFAELAPEWVLIRGPKRGNIPEKETLLSFPSAREIIYFEGANGPDGLKRKSPGKDEPTHFIIPDADDGVLIKDIMDRHHNLHEALLKGDKTRAAFEAAWLAHALTDGLTPAHHYPYQEAVSELMSDKEYVTIFGQPVKGIMHGKTFAESARNNWIYWGVEGVMSKHIAFEYGCAMVVKPLPSKRLFPKLSPEELEKLKNYSTLDLKKEFYASLAKIDHLKMYDRFRKKGWNAELALETRQILLPEIVKIITIGWLASLPTKEELEK